MLHLFRPFPLLVPCAGLCLVALVVHAERPSSTKDLERLAEAERT